MSDLITSTPGVRSGRPCIAGTGLLTAAVADRVRAGETVAAVADDYGVTEAQVNAAVAYERKQARRRLRGAALAPWARTYRQAEERLRPVVGAPEPGTEG